ncbi:MAG: FMN-dependent NADH-azoreductase [Spirulinaceae cyanobacterium RM2_2_10]|nr:FMN-dependent NADH-azoreductase [Spirulinaceae cyanobacterium RM2_2_10]
MKPLLIINASGRITRSITRHLTTRFADGWRSRQPGAEILIRDVGVNPPPPVDEAWIAAAFAPAHSRNSIMQQSLATSEALIDELVQSQAIVIGVPMYNFGMPAQLKAYFDQIIRVGRTFSFDPDSPEPYRPLLEPKPVVVIISAGDGSLHPGGSLAHHNFVEPHLHTLFWFLGFSQVHVVRVGYVEYQDDRFAQSITTAEATVEDILDSWSLDLQLK